MSILDLTLRDMLPTARHAALMSYVRLRNRVRHALRRAEPHTPAPQRRPVRSRFVGLQRDGSDLWMDTELPSSLTFPVMIGGATASYMGTDRPFPMHGGSLQFGSRVFHLSRIVRADHLGPAEAEYRELGP